jgi:hypothetical protein
MGGHGVLIERKGGYLLLALGLASSDASIDASAGYAVVTVAGDCIRREFNLDDARAWLETLVREDLIVCERNTPAPTRAGPVR